MAFSRFILTLAIVVLVMADVLLAKVQVNTDINLYNNYIGETAEEEYKHKLGVDESIFPKEISEGMEVEDYKMVYYNPWDPQYLSYLVVNYDDEVYMQEWARLDEIGCNDYIGIYGVTGFTKYQLIAMNANEYHGFVYALTDGDGKIIYVELLFCNYFYDISYNDYINSDYLPDGFDATIDNAYRKEKLDG